MLNRCSGINTQQCNTLSQNITVKINILLSLADKKQILRVQQKCEKEKCVVKMKYYAQYH